MFQALSRIWTRFTKAVSEWKRANEEWQRANEEAHRRLGHGHCCAAPIQVYGSRPQHGETETKR